MKKQWKIIGLGCMAALCACLWLSAMYVSPATANICFLPSGKCGDATASSSSSGDEPNSENCTGFNDSYDKGWDQGWSCNGPCTKSDGTQVYKCECRDGFIRKGDNCYLKNDQCKTTGGYTYTATQATDMMDNTKNPNTAWQCTRCDISGSEFEGKYRCQCNGVMKNSKCVHDTCVGYNETSCPDNYTKEYCPDDSSKLKCSCNIQDGKRLKDDGTCEDIVECTGNNMYTEEVCAKNKNNKSNSDHWMCEKVGTTECYLLSKKCDNSQKEYIDQESCLADNPQYLCDKTTSDNVCRIPGTLDCQDARNGKYTTKDKCEKAIYPYKCKEEKTGGCWIKDGTEKDCSRNEGFYNNEDDCRSANSGFGCLMDSATSCWYKSDCDEVAGFFTSQEACQSAAENVYTCTKPTESFCYRLDKCNVASNYYSTQDDCLAASEGHMCDEVRSDKLQGWTTYPGNCWTPNNTLCDESKHEYNTEAKCEAVFGEGSCMQQSNQCWIGNDARCLEELGQYPTEPLCEAVYGTGNCIIDEMQCYIAKDNLCDESRDEFRLVTDCEKKFGQGKCVKGDNGCYISNDCPEGFSTEIQTALDCGDGSIGSLGWKVETNGEVGGKACGRCVENDCPDGYGIDCSRQYACDLCVGYDEDNPGANKAYKGDAECKRYETVEGQQHAICNLLGTGYRMYSQGNVPEGWGKVQASGRETGCYCAKEGAVCDETTEFAKLDDCENKYGTDKCEQDEETLCYREKNDCEGYPYVRASTNGAVAYGTTAWSTNGIIPYLKSTKSIYVAHNDHFEGDFNDEVFNMIATNAKTCTDSNGIVHYDKICGGTPKAKCTESDVTTFSHNGCVSGTYTAHHDGSSYYKPSGSEWGTCSKNCSAVYGSDYYNTSSECGQQTGKTCISDNDHSGCWSSCESHKYYSSQSECENGKSGSCIAKDGCYVRNTFFIRTKPGQTHTQHGRPCSAYTSGQSGTASWWNYISDNNMQMPTDVNGLTSNDIDNTREFTPGTYYICTHVEDNCPGGRSWGIKATEIIGYAVDSNGGPVYGYTPGGSYCFGDSPSGMYSRCAQTDKVGNNWSCHPYNLQAGFIYEVNAYPDW